MCSPAIIERVCAGMSRRDLLRLAAVAAGSHLVAPAPVEAAPLRPGHVRDLTHTLRRDFPSYNGRPLFSSRVTSTLARNGLYGLDVSYFEHIGTHMDAPAHVAAGAPTVERLAPATLIAPVAVIAIHERARRDADAALTVDDVLGWEGRHGRLPRGSAVFMHSGWESRVGSSARYRNADPSGTMHFPGFHPDATALLLHERDVVGIGVDTLSLDVGASQDLRTHRTWLPAGRWGLENLAGLATIPPAGAWVFVGAPKVAGGSGGPCRVLAVW